MKKFITIYGILFFLAFSNVFANHGVAPKQYKMQFIENKGQIVDQNYTPNSAVKYLFCRPGFNVQLRQTGFSYDTYTDQLTDENSGGMPMKKVQPPGAAASQQLNFSRHFHRVDVELQNCNSSAEIISSGRSASCFNYFTAGTPEGGITGVHCYDRIVYKNIYPSIDLEFFGNDNGDKTANSSSVEYQFVLHAGANISDIKLSYTGADEMSLEKGQLNIKVSTAPFTEKIPSSYLKENGQQVEVNYHSLGNNIYSFSTPHPFTITSDLVIDPTPCFVWGTYYGGNGWDIGSGIVLDANKNVYIAGSTQSTNNIATTGAYQTTFSGGSLYDIYVAEFNPTGTTLLWGTYFGGSGNDGENRIAIDSSGVYIAGYAHSTGLATNGAWQTTCPNCNGTYCDVIIAKFSLAGALLWSTYYGTSGYGQANDITVDTSGVYIAGDTYASTGISTPGAWQTVYGGSLDAFVAKFNLSGSQLLWGTYYGNDQGLPWGLAVDTKGNVYIGGYCNSPDSVKVTHGAYQTTYGGGEEGFVAKFNSTGSSLLYGTYFGGTGDDIIYDIAVDVNGYAYFTGYTTSTSGIATPGAYQTVNAGTCAFVAKIDTDGTSLLWSTYYGGGVHEESWSIALDAANDAYISGGTQSPTGIATAGAYQTTLNGSANAFIAKFSSTTSSLIWGTYYGGVGSDNLGSTYLRIGGIIIGPSYDLYITGFTGSSNGIASHGAWQTYNAGSPDAFVAKFGCNVILEDVPSPLLNSTAISVFPNPFNNEFTIQNLSGAVYRLNIYNELGQNVYSDIISDKQKTIAFKPSEGIYLLQLTDGKETWTEKIVKQ